MIVKDLVAALKSFGIRAAAYKRAPETKDVFVMSILPKKKEKEGVIAIHQGLAEIEVHGSKKQRQAVVTVRERARVVTRLVKTNVFNLATRPDDILVKENLRASFPISMPGKPTWEFSEIKVTQKKAPMNSWSIQGIVTAKVGKATTSHFLMGVDESHNFIAPLPKKATSVEEAHKILKPKAKLIPGTKRQGEWFFEPLIKAIAAKIDGLLNSHPVRQVVLGGSTHTATGISVRERDSETTKRGRKAKGGRVVVYARGYVTDRRRGHHQSLWLPNWHKVVRNKEVSMPRRKRSARRTRWD